MLRIILTICCLLLPLQAKADFKDWSEADKDAYIAFATVSIIDMLQTRSAMRDPCNCYTELNPILGKKAEDHELLLLNGAVLYLLYRSIDSGKTNKRWRNTLNVITGIRVGVIFSNQQQGINIKYAF